jgi:enolase
MATISHVTARQILDSRGNPTIEADVTLADGSFGRAAVPSGASTGSHEAHELRDGGEKYGGKGVEKAVAHVKGEIAGAVTGMDAAEQRALDKAMIALDGTEHKERLGANALLAVSLAAAKAQAVSAKVPLYAHITTIAGKNIAPLLPLPMCNVINGGKHAENSTDIQEFMIMPVGARTFSHAIQMTTEIFHALKAVFKEAGQSTTVGDEGGFPLNNVTKGNKEAFELLSRAVEKAGYALGEDVAFAIDAAASEFQNENGQYVLATEGKTLSAEEMVAYYEELVQEYPLISIEDGLGEDDWSAWVHLTERLGNKVQLVGDDLLVTNTTFLQRAIDEQAANAILIKLNQIGTLTETIDAVALAREHNFKSVISHRSGETEDTTIAHLAVGLGTGQIKTGSMSRTDRVAKYNELLRIEEGLGSEAVLAELVTSG